MIYQAYAQPIFFFNNVFIQIMNFKVYFKKSRPYFKILKILSQVGYLMGNLIYQKLFVEIIIYIYQHFQKKKNHMLINL